MRSRSCCRRPLGVVARTASGVVSPAEAPVQPHASTGTSVAAGSPEAESGITQHECQSAVESSSSHASANGSHRANPPWEVGRADDEEAAADRRASGSQASTSTDGPGKTVRLIRGPGGRVMRAGEGEDAAQGSSLRSSPRIIPRSTRGASQGSHKEACGAACPNAYPSCNALHITALCPTCHAAVATCRHVASFHRRRRRGAAERHGAAGARPWRAHGGRAQAGWLGHRA